MFGLELSVVEGNAVDLVLLPTGSSIMCAQTKTYGIRLIQYSNSSAKCGQRM